MIFFYLGWIVLVLLLVVDGLVEVVAKLPGVGPVGFHVARQEILQEDDTKVPSKKYVC